MSRNPNYQPTQGRNPRQITIEQHVHSRSCIQRFQNPMGRVDVLEHGRRPRASGPRAAIFCAQRVWDQRVEHGALTRRIERAFHVEAESIVASRSVTSHDAVSEYLSLWQIRADLDEAPPADVVLNGLAPTTPLTHDQEEILETKHAFFARGNVVPGRFVPSTTALISHERNMRALVGARWGVLHATGASRFICPDRPNREQYIPLTRTLALVTRYADMDVGDETVDDLNASARAQARCFVFGHPLDIASFHARG